MNPLPPYRILQTVPLIFGGASIWTDSRKIRLAVARDPSEPETLYKWQVINGNDLVELKAGVIDLYLSSVTPTLTIHVLAESGEAYHLTHVLDSFEFAASIPFKGDAA